MLRNTNKHFWRHCQGTIVVVISKPSSLVYPFILSFFSFYSFTNGAQNRPKYFCSQGRLCRTTIVFEANHSFQLWTPPWLYSHGLGTNLLRFRLWKPIHTLEGVWVALCLPNHFGHVTRNTSVEVVSFLTWWEGETMVCPQRREGSWRLERTKEHILSCILP